MKSPALQILEAPLPMAEQEPVQPTLIWEWPMRAWHWIFALCAAGSLATGLAGDIALMEWHLRLGYCAIGLLIFRLLWGVIGGIHSRWRWYRPSIAGLFRHFRGAPDRGGHTAPGVLLALGMLLAVAIQALTGLYSTDEIFTEGPLVRSADPEVVSVMTAVHHRVYWVVLGLIGAHLAAHVVYAARGSRLPLAMFTGRKPVAPGTPSPAALGGRGLLTGAAVALFVWGALAWLG